MSKPKILATSFHPGGINPIIPVIKQINQDSLAEIVVVGEGDAAKSFLKQAKIDYRTIQDYSLSDVSVPSMNNLLRQTTPDMILTGTSTQEGTRHIIEQTLTLAAKGLQIPSLAVLDFWGNYHERFTDEFTGEKFVYLPDQVAIMDQFAEKAMIEEGFPQERLKITGNPHFDGLEDKTNSFTAENKQQILQKVGLETKEVSLFYAAGVWRKYKEQYGFWDLDNLDLIRGSLKNLGKDYAKRTGVVVKLHPRNPQEDTEQIRKILEDQESFRLVTGTEYNPRDFVLASDLTTTVNSTLAFEAVYMHRPVISLQPGLKTKNYLEVLTDNGLVPVGKTTENCIKLVQDAVSSEAYRHDLISQSSSFRTDGKATQRVTNLVYEILGIGG